MNRTQQACAYCGRTGVPKTHGHHTIPRSKGGTEIVPTCGACGSFIHATWTNNELRDAFNTVVRVQADERYQRFLRWLLKQKCTIHFKTYRSKHRKN